MERPDVIKELKEAAIAVKTAIKESIEAVYAIVVNFLWDAVQLLKDILSFIKQCLISLIKNIIKLLNKIISAIKRILTKLVRLLNRVFKFIVRVPLGIILIAPLRILRAMEKVGEVLLKDE